MSQTPSFCVCVCVCVCNCKREGENLLIKNVEILTDYPVNCQKIIKSSNTMPDIKIAVNVLATCGEKQVQKDMMLYAET